MTLNAINNVNLKRLISMVFIAKIGPQMYLQLYLWGLLWFSAFWQFWQVWAAPPPPILPHTTILFLAFSLIEKLLSDLQFKILESQSTFIVFFFYLQIAQPFAVHYKLTRKTQNVNPECKAVSTYPNNATGDWKGKYI